MIKAQDQGQMDESKEVMIEVDRLYDRIGDLNETVSTLEDRLGAVLRAEPTQTNSGKDPEARKSELGETLRAQNEKLESFNSRLAHILDRLAV